MTLEGEYYLTDKGRSKASVVVAILMTLEGEYYPHLAIVARAVWRRRNPHDIGRRILRYG